MQNKQGILIAIVIVIILIGGAWYLNSHPASPSTSQTATTTPSTSTTTSSTIPGGTSTSPTTSVPAPTTYAVNTLPISSKDTLASWSFKGSHADGGALQQGVESNIDALKTQLKTQLTTNDPTVQKTYISIGNNYELLGDGKNAYNYFLKALNGTQRYEQEDGLAWVNLGDLMQTLHAYYTAATAYGSAVKADPGEPSFHVARIQFLTSYLPKEIALINTAFADANKDVPGDASIAQLQAQYKAQTQ